MSPSGQTPRTLLLSIRNYEQDVWRCSQVEFENVVRATDQAEIVAPRAYQHTPGFALRQVERVTKRVLGLGLSYVPRLETIRLTRDYDVLCVYAQALGDLTILDAVPDWRSRCAKAVCILEEVWACGLPRFGQRTFDALAKFDLITCGQHGTVEPLRALVGRPCEWLPGGVDALRFFPGLRPPARTIDVFAMGRRSEISHRALLEHATRSGWTYLFDTLDARHVRGGDHMQHRTQLAELVKRSRYFLANRGRVDRVEDTGEQEELGYRSFEGAAGGAVLIGDAPHRPHCQSMFDWPDAHVHVPFDSTAMAEVIVTLDRDPERVARIRRNNVVQTLRRHDWSYRWRTVLDWLGVAPSAGLERRRQELQDLAALTEGAPAEAGLERRSPARAM